MRKFAIPKYIYVLLVLMLGVLSIGYTYAYFSSTYKVESKLKIGQVNVVWCDRGTGNVINGENKTIFVTSEELDVGEFSPIQTPTDEDGVMQEIVLEVCNRDATVSAYVRIKIDAKYTPNGESNSINCGEQWVQLALNNNGVNQKLTENGNWFYDNGYYYYGTNNGTSKTLTELDINSGKTVASHIYLDNNVDADIYGAIMSITLTVEAVQTTNNAYQSVWGVNW